MRAGCCQSGAGPACPGDGWWSYPCGPARHRSPNQVRNRERLASVDRIERHDLVNAVGLAVILMALALGFLWAAQQLYQTVNGEVVQAESSDDGSTSTTVVDDGTSSTTATTEAETTTTEPVLRPTSEITVRVANGAGIGGIAGFQTDILAEAGYQTATPTNVADVTGAGRIYFAEGYAADAAQVARVLRLDDSAVVPVGDPPPFEADGAQILIVVGPDTEVRP